MSNHLKDQSSPYLLQHCENPVDWYPWCREAFEKAEREDKPVFLSIGYSTCHWCHVMARESFEDRKIADILNRYFISVKVDREERPDIDSVYMSVCQALTGSGGWPMSIFMTAQQKPFYAGTYFPPSSRYGAPGFGDLLLAIAEKWKNGKQELLQSADQILAHISASDSTKNEKIDSGLPEKAAEIFSRSFDSEYGGFGTAPKFPTPHNLIFLMLYAQIHGEQQVHSEASYNQVRVTLEAMRRGGIFDHIGYGFSRYSTDRYYLVPHFEKMLYDNALLILAYAIFYNMSGERIFLDTAEKTALYIFREMTGAEGQFYSAQDADSDGEEGKYYVWDYDEICKILGEEKGGQFCRHFGVTEEGNFEGKNILNLLNGNSISDEFDEELRVLYDHRKTRTKLHLDDKILTTWNSLMICALAVLYRVTGCREYLTAAKKAQSYIEKNLAEGNILYVSCRRGVRSSKGFLDEYAYYTAALLFLYEAAGDAVYLDRARQICGEAMRQFEDRNGGYFLYGKENGSLITRPKETYDGALPSGNSVMAYCLVRLFQLTEDEAYQLAAQRQLAYLSGEAEDYPAGCSVFLAALLFLEYPPQKITVVLPRKASRGNETVREQIGKLPLYADIKFVPDGEAGHTLINGRTTYYVCRDHTCLPPVNEMEKLSHF